MKAYPKALLLAVFSILFFSCRTINTTQTSVVRKFAGTAKEVSDLPYKVMYNYYSIRFKRKQLIPENYVTGETEKEELDNLAENVISRIEEIRDEYHGNLKTANEIKAIYQLLEAYIYTLEKLSADKYSQDFEKRSAEMGKKMNGLVTKLNASTRTRMGLSMNPGQWLSSLATVYGRVKLKSMQHSLLKDYINTADTLVQAINYNYQEIQVPIMQAWFEEEKSVLRDQFKRSIAPYLQYLNRHPDSATTVVAVEFYSKINPVYYELTEEIYRNEQLIRQTSALMKNLAGTHSALKTMFKEGKNWASVLEQVDGLRDGITFLKNLFQKDGQDKFLFYKNFLMQNETDTKNIFDKH